MSVEFIVLCRVFAWLGGLYTLVLGLHTLNAAGHTDFLPSLCLLFGIASVALLFWLTQHRAVVLRQRAVRSMYSARVRK
jgi:hypothetical protein